MVDLHKFQARTCLTAAGAVVRQGQVLLVRHKKLGIWLPPGGHVEEWELPHEAAVREVYEETGINAAVISAVPVIESTVSQFLPLPIDINLHWISKENYSKRLLSSNPNLPHSTKKWPRGCEQHLGYLYLMKPLSHNEVRFDENESTGIGWFDTTDLNDLDTTDDVRTEVSLALQSTALSD